MDVLENERMTIEFKEVDVTNAQELHEAPELIGAHLVTENDDGKELVITRLTGLFVFLV